MFVPEPNMEKRMDAAKELANRLLHAQFEDEREFILAMHWIISRERNIPLFSPYFADRTFDELILEVELIRLSRTPTLETSSATLAAGTDKEKDELFDFMPPDPTPEDNRFMADAVDFMNSGEFKE